MAACLRQIVPDMGQRKKKILDQMFLFLHEGRRQRFVCRMQILIVLLECKVKGDRTDTEGLFQKWN